MWWCPAVGPASWKLPTAGRKTPVRLYELLMRSVPAAELAPQLAFFADARRCLRRRDFGGACVSLEAVLEAWAEDGAARILLARCQAYAADPAGFDRDYQDGVRVLQQK